MQSVVAGRSCTVTVGVVNALCALYVAMPEEMTQGFGDLKSVEAKTQVLILNVPAASSSRDLKAPACSQSHMSGTSLTTVLGREALLKTLGERRT